MFQQQYDALLAVCRTYVNDNEKLKQEKAELRELVERLKEENRQLNEIILDLNLEIFEIREAGER